ncbi:PepSY domain-containing protein [Candidatus Pacearchaeota archaeon]|nr:PepSY domain-containing protein [Candidatus Pacearchaeota archaeon]
MVNLGAKQIAQKAAEYLQELKNVSDISLEEIELVGEGYWLVTLSYTSYNILDSKEHWKVFKIDASTGEVLSMKSK